MALDNLLLSERQRDEAAAACAAYEGHVDAAARYLVSRGVEQAAARRYRLGVVESPAPGHERFQGMLSIPYLSSAGVLGFKFRCLDGHNCKEHGHPKYDSPAGQKARLFGVNALLSGLDTIAVVEGEMAAIILQSVVGIPTVGTPGTQWLEHWPRCFADFERVLVVADHDVHPNGDSPGIKHAKKVVSTIHGAQLILPPPGLDPDEWVAAEGVERVREALGVEA